MKYLVIEIQKNADGAVGNLVYAYDSINDAESKYHTVLASAAVSGLPSHAAVLLNETGFCVKHECYIVEPEPEPEPEPEEEGT